MRELEEKPVEQLKGRKLDAAVATEIFDKRVEYREADLYVEHGIDYCEPSDMTTWDIPEAPNEERIVWSPIRQFSFYMGDAWNIVLELGLSFRRIEYDDHCMFVVEFYEPTMGCHQSAVGEIEHIPEAICRAALKTVRTNE